MTPVESPLTHTQTLPSGDTLLCREPGMLWGRRMFSQCRQQPLTLRGVAHPQQCLHRTRLIAGGPASSGRRLWTGSSPCEGAEIPGQAVQERHRSVGTISSLHFRVWSSTARGDLTPTSHSVPWDAGLDSQDCSGCKGLLTAQFSPSLTLRATHRDTREKRVERERRGGQTFANHQEQLSCCEVHHGAALFCGSHPPENSAARRVCLSWQSGLWWVQWLQTVLGTRGNRSTSH